MNAPRVQYMLTLSLVMDRLQPGSIFWDHQQRRLPLYRPLSQYGCNGDHSVYIQSRLSPWHSGGLLDKRQFRFSKVCVACDVYNNSMCL